MSGVEGTPSGPLLPPLAAAFPATSREDWEAAVETALKGRSFDSLLSSTDGGVELQPLYIPAETPTGHDESGFPGSAPATRGATAVPRPGGRWDVRRPIDEPDAFAGNRAALRDLERGVTSLEVPFPPASADDLAGRLDGVLLDLAPVVLRPGWDFESAAEALEALWSAQGLAPEAALGGFGADPFGTLAARGQGSRPVGEALTAAATLAARTVTTRPQVRAMTISSLPAFEAGASEVLEVAVVLSTGAAYLRELSSVGLDVDAATAQIEVEVAADADVFTTLAKVRAVRRVWAALAASCGATDPAGSLRLSVRTARRMMTSRDPWVNLLRVTAAAFAAGVAGADSVTTESYDLLLAEHGELGRRMARNTQLLLIEESNLGRVADPAGGSAFLESLTEQIASAAWGRFRELEAAGGVGATLVDGTLAARITDERNAQLARVATRRRPITGVSEFPDADESAPALAVDPAGTPLLVPVRWAEGYEDLRSAADAAREDGATVDVFLANLGPVAVHTARATFARNLFAAGGVRAITGEVGSVSGYEDVAALVADVVDSGASLVCICSSDAVYAERAAEVAAALAPLDGVRRVYLAGAPGEDRSRLEEAGVNEFVHVGVDALDVLRRAQHECGVGTGGAR